jgi:precorrin-6A/cobalt-precorrin-6A reductase
MEFFTMPSQKEPPQVLILGGTSEASELAAILSPRIDFRVISSVAGRVSQPTLPMGVVRVGGFGGIDGLIAYLAQENIAAVIDATHPYASQISHNAELACACLNLPLIAYERPPWKPEEGDCWLPVRDAAAAALLVNHTESRVFLSIGRQELGAFTCCEAAWFLVRTIDTPEEKLPANSKLILARGPFRFEAEMRMLRSEGINRIVSKNSGGTATYPKIEAGRALGIPIVMLDRPRKHTVPTVVRRDDVLLRLAELFQTVSD